jgi:hypothetical protein
MALWDGTRWVEDKPSPTTNSRRMGRHISGALAEGGLITLLALGLIAGNVFGAKDNSAGGRALGTISVTDATGAAALSGMSSAFTASGCGFRAGDAASYLVVRGPGMNTTSLTYWVDPFPVGSDGCGSAAPSWSGSGVAGFFDVYVVRSPSGNPWQAQPTSNVVTVNITTP